MSGERAADGGEPDGIRPQPQRGHQRRVGPGGVHQVPGPDLGAVREADDRAVRARRRPADLDAPAHVGAPVARAAQQVGVDVGVVEVRFGRRPLGRADLDEFGRVLGPALPVVDEAVAVLRADGPGDVGVDVLDGRQPGQLRRLVALGQHPEETGGVHAHLPGREGRRLARVDERDAGPAGGQHGRQRRRGQGAAEDGDVAEVPVLGAAGCAVGRVHGCSFLSRAAD